MAAPGRGRPSWVGVGGAAHPAGGRSGVGVCWGALPAQVVALRPPSARGCQHSPAAPQPHRDVAAGRGAARPSWSPERAVPLRAGGCPGPGPPSSSRGGPSVRGPEPPAELAEGSGYSVLTGGPFYLGASTQEDSRAVRQDGAPLWVPTRAARGPGRAAASSGSGLRARTRLWCCYRGGVGLRAAEEGLGPILPHHLFAQSACVRRFAPSSGAGRAGPASGPCRPFLLWGDRGLGSWGPGEGGAGSGQRARPLGCDRSRLPSPASFESTRGRRAKFPELQPVGCGAGALVAHTLRIWINHFSVPPVVSPHTHNRTCILSRTFMISEVTVN